MPMTNAQPESQPSAEFESLTSILIKSKDLPKVDNKEENQITASHAGNRLVNATKGSTQVAANGQALNEKPKSHALNGNAFKTVRKRDGRIASFDPETITKAVLAAMTAVSEGTQQDARDVTQTVVENLMRQNSNGRALGIEYIQDEVEKALILDDYAKTAKAYILYRNKRAQLREEEKEAPDQVKHLVKESKKYFKNQLAELVFYQFYSRWLPEEGRRETWIEAIDRFMDYMRECLGDKLNASEYKEVREAILSQDVCPSMRLLWAAGPAARATHTTIYNCAYIAPTQPRDLGEIMYLSMSGAGVGFSVEHENVEKFPQIRKQTGDHLGTMIVGDNKEGWADAFVAGLDAWFDGKEIDFDFSEVRPAGARLETMGGRASGPEPLRQLLEFSKSKIFSRQGRRLRTIDLHDIICKSGECVVAGGVRRSALISLSDLDDPLMRDSKKGQFYMTNPQRSMANNSAVYDSKPSAEEFLDEWMSLMKGKSGERGIFNRAGLEKQIPRRRWEMIKNQKQIGVNPCGEIYLRSKQFCNLTSIVVRAEDNADDMERKMRVAALLGTYQATLTDFNYISKEWKENSEAERLLGISITGYYDSKLARDPFVLRRLRETAIDANRYYSDKFGIEYSTAITCVKPHGNSSQLLDTASGMHPRYAPYYIRRIRIHRTDPLFKMLVDQGVPYNPEVGQTEENANTFVLEFPVQAPEGSPTKDQVTAIDMLKEWKNLKENFTEHNPSVTIYIGEEEWVSVANFLYENWDIVGGLSFLPRDDHVYQLAPYEEITKEEYEYRVRELGELDFSKLYSFEREDNTKGAKEFACMGGACEI